MIAAWETEGDNPDEPASKLPLWRTIKLSYVTYMHHFADALRVTWLWMVLIAGLLAGSDWLRWSWTVWFAERFKAGEIMELGVYPILAVGLSVLAFLVVVLASLDIAVAWHRQLILGERPRLSGSTFASRAPWRYLAILVGLILVSAIPVVLIFIVDLLDLEALSDRSLQIVAASVVIVVLGAALSNFVRLSLVLPARAAGSSHIQGELDHDARQYMAPAGWNVRMLDPAVYSSAILAIFIRRAEFRCPDERDADCGC
jgi:hypothetical protein